MVNNVEMVDALRGNPQDLFKEAFEDKGDEFWKMFDARSDKDALFEKFKDFDEDFAEAWLGETRDMMAASSAWNSVAVP